MDEIILNNKYINIIYIMFNAHLNGKKIELKRKTEKKFLGFIPITVNEAYLENLMVENANDELKVFINKEMTNTFDMVNFKSMWQFCQFVRFAEKVFNYINRPERKLYVDSDMNDLSKRSFKISTDDKTMDIFCFLEKVNEPINKKNICVIRLKIQRKYGKQMMNEFTIVDDFVKSKDTSDSMLIDNIFNLIATEMKDTFSSIISKAVFIAEERKKNEKGSDSNE